MEIDEFPVYSFHFNWFLMADLGSVRCLNFFLPECVTRCSLLRSYRQE